MTESNPRNGDDTGKMQNYSDTDISGTTLKAGTPLSGITPIPAAHRRSCGLRLVFIDEDGAPRPPPET
jgi:hypothetical protein